MKILYRGLETFEFSYCGEYEVVRQVPRPNGMGLVCIDNLGDESFIGPGCYEVIE